MGGSKLREGMDMLDCPQQVHKAICHATMSSHELCIMTDCFHMHKHRHRIHWIF